MPWNTTQKTNRTSYTSFQSSIQRVMPWNWLVYVFITIDVLPSFQSSIQESCRGTWIEQFLLTETFHFQSLFKESCRGTECGRTYGRNKKRFQFLVSKSSCRGTFWRANDSYFYYISVLFTKSHAVEHLVKLKKQHWLTNNFSPLFTRVMPWKLCKSSE